MPANDLIAQQLSTFQTQQLPAPVTVASAASIAISTFLTFISGTTQITNITPFLSGAHMIMLVFTNAAPGGLGSGGASPGAIKTSVTAAQNVPVLLMWDPTSTQWWAGTIKLS